MSDFGDSLVAAAIRRGYSHGYHKRKVPSEAQTEELVKELARDMYEEALERSLGRAARAFIEHATVGRRERGQ